MVKVNKKVAADNRARIVRSAGVRMRAEGIAATSVAKIAESAGLTHGAIYQNFSSKEALAAEAISADFDAIIEVLKSIEARGGDARDYIETYLSKSHRDDFAWGCPAGALSMEIARTDSLIQQAFAEGANRLLERAAPLAGDSAQSRPRAMTMIATLIGALALSRAFKHSAPAVADDILEVAKADLIARLPGRTAGD